METDDNIKDLEPSTDPNLDDQPNLTDDVKSAEPADSSAATGENEDDLLSVVRDVVKEKESEAASPAEGEETTAPEEETPEEQDDEDYSKVPFNKHPRFQKLLRERNTFKQDATRYQNVQSFLDERGLSADEAAEGLVIMGLMKTDPVAAWERLKPAVQKLLLATGEILPDDLRGRVQTGELSQEAAIEISKARASVESTRVAQSFAEQQQQRRVQFETVQACQNAAESWEQERWARDPNFAAKQEPLRKEILYLQATEGRPNTPQGVRAQLEKAYKAVGAAGQPAVVAAPKKVVKPITGGQVAGNQAPAARSTLDIIRANRRAG